MALVIATRVAERNWLPLITVGICLLVVAGAGYVVAQTWRRYRGGQW